MPLRRPETQIITEVPAGAWFRLEYVFVEFPRTIGSNDPVYQSSPNLRVQLFDSRSRSLTHDDTGVAPFLTPGGTDTYTVGPIGYARGGVRALPYWGLDYAPLTRLKMVITGMTSAGPPSVSVTYLGMRKAVPT